MTRLGRMIPGSDALLLPANRRQYRRFERPGLSERQERIVNIGSTALVALFAIGWTYALSDSRVRESLPSRFGTAATTNPLSPDAPPPAVYLIDAAIRQFASRTDFRGLSGAVNVAVQKPGETLPLPDSLGADVRVEYAAPGDTMAGAPQPSEPGVWNLLVRIGNAIRPVPDLSVITLVPLSQKKAGRIGSYVIGSWPYEAGGRPRSPAYAPPAGLVRVTPANLNTQLSEHFQLRDFLTKGQTNVWPKYVALSPLLLDKLELTIQELERSGHDVKDVGVISGFRTPSYNEAGGETSGRGALSRHMYGDAMDIYIDGDRDGRMDDLNRDGRVDIGDARVLGAAADRVEKKYPSLIGGIGIYRPTGAHSGFVHIDTRGYRARW
ncbi:MAG: hypothetical protein WEE89_00930 [Gemmatimonadota bacterium]